MTLSTLMTLSTRTPGLAASTPGLAASRLAAALLLAGVPLTGSLAQSRATPGAEPSAPEQKAPQEVAPGARVELGLTGDWRASKLIGATMTNMLDESIGNVEDVVIDSDGKVVAVLVGVGGFLGIGETQVAIGFRHLIISRLDPDHLEVKTSLSRDAIEQAAALAPDYDRPVTP